MGALKTDAIVTQNIYASEYAAGSYTVPAGTSGRLSVRLYLTGLNAAAASLTFRLAVTPSGGSAANAVWYTAPKFATANTTIILIAPVLDVEEGDQVDVYVQSDNSSDTGVSGNCKYFDPLADVGAVYTLVDALPTLAELLAGDVDSTGTPITLAKALEVCVAVICGKRTYNDGTGEWVAYGRDAATPIVTQTLTDEGDGNAPTIG